MKPITINKHCLVGKEIYIYITRWIWILYMELIYINIYISVPFIFVHDKIFNTKNFLFEIFSLVCFKLLQSVCQIKYYKTIQNELSNRNVYRNSYAKSFEIYFFFQRIGKDLFLNKISKSYFKRLFLRGLKTYHFIKHISKH